MGYSQEDVDREIALQIEKARKERQEAVLHLWKKDSTLNDVLFREWFQIVVSVSEFREIDPDNPRWQGWSTFLNDALKYYINQAKKRGIFADKSVSKYTKFGQTISGPKLRSQLKSFFKKNYTIYDSKNPAGKNHPDKIKCCPVCFKPVPLGMKYCNSKCRLTAYYERRNKTKGIQKTIEIHTHCLICGKSLEGKRAGTKTCSQSCRKQLSLNRIAKKMVTSS